MCFWQDKGGIDAPSDAAQAQQTGRVAFHSPSYKHM